MATSATSAARPQLTRYIAVRTLTSLAMQAQAVALGWYVYKQTGSAFALGLLGLVQFLPAIPLTILTGHAADHFDRRTVVLASLWAQGIGAGALCVFTSLGHAGVWPSFAAVFLIGCARPFTSPALRAMLPSLVERPALSKAVALSSSVNQLAVIVGPSLGGVVYGLWGPGVFLMVAGLTGVAGLALMGLKAPRAPPEPGGSSAWERAFAGLIYVRANRLLLGAMSLDLMACLVGGVTSLLPIFASDILHVGPQGLGLLASGPAIGASVIGLVLARRPLKRAGATMLWCVAGYGLAIIVFGLSSNFWLSMAALIALGGFDMVSIVVRQTLVQVATPDAMLGRVLAVNDLFVGASNRLADFESGVVAGLVGAAPAAVIGGVGTLIVTLFIASRFPELRRADKLDQQS